MNFEQVLELVKTVSDSELTVFSYEEGNQKIVMQTGNVLYGGICPEVAAGNPAGMVATQEMTQMSVDAAPVKLPDGVQGSTTLTGKDTDNLAGKEESAGNVVSSPLVGRFYGAPAEGADDFVKVGDRVKKGQVLAIVEAMKLMNEIESDCDGIVTEILVNNGESVEFGQPLFRIV